MPLSVVRELLIAAGRSSCQLLRTIDRPPRSDGFLIEGVRHFLTQGGKKTPWIAVRDQTFGFQAARGFSPHSE